MHDVEHPCIDVELTGLFGRWGKDHSQHDWVKKGSTSVKRGYQAPSNLLLASLTPYTSPPKGFLGLSGYPLPGNLENASWGKKDITVTDATLELQVFNTQRQLNRYQQQELLPCWSHWQHKEVLCLLQWVLILQNSVTNCFLNCS